MKIWENLNVLNYSSFFFFSFFFLLKKKTNKEIVFLINFSISFEFHFLRYHEFVETQVTVFNIQDK